MGSFGHELGMDRDGSATNASPNLGAVALPRPAPEVELARDQPEPPHSPNGSLRGAQRCESGHLL